jgi:hypothetical protein
MKHAVYNGWRIQFRPNIYMYCHQLIATKDSLALEVPCEDTPDGYVGIWPYNLGIPEPTYADLLVALRAWVVTIRSPYRLYITREIYET